MPGGRPLKLTDARRKLIVDAVKEGAYREPAAKGAGIGVTTLYRWLEQGEADAEHGVQSDFRKLWEAVEKAEGTAENDAVRVVREAAQSGNWQAAMTYLERKYPARWGRRLKLTDDTPRAPAPLHGQTVAEFEANFRAAFGDQLDVDPRQLMPGFFDTSSSNGSTGNGAGP